MLEYLPLLVLFLACTVQSAFGFGLALIAVPLLSAVLPLALVTPLLALLSLSLGGTIAWRARESIRTDLLWRLFLSASLGVPMGIAFVVSLDGNVVRFALGVVITVAALHGLLGFGERIRITHFAVWPFGIITGVLGGAWNLMGPPLVLFLQWTKLDQAQFRATLHAFSFAINVLMVCSWMILPERLGGIGGVELAKWYIITLVPLFVGGWAGSLIVNRVDAARYRGAVYGLLFVTGAGLIVTTL